MRQQGFATKPFSPFLGEPLEFFSLRSKCLSVFHERALRVFPCPGRHSICCGPRTALVDREGGLSDGTGPPAKNSMIAVKHTQDPKEHVGLRLVVQVGHGEVR